MRRPIPTGSDATVGLWRGSFSTGRLPAPALRPYIERYVGYRLSGFAPGVHRGMPSRHLTFIVSIGPTIDVIAQTNRDQAPASYSFVVSGLQDSTALIAHNGEQEGVAFELTPLGARAVLDLPARELWNLSLEADGVIGCAAPELRERLHATPAWDERFDLCDEVLGRVMVEPREVAPEVREAWRVVVGTGGTVTVNDLARHVGWSRRHLAQRFREEFGLSPKRAARVVRFERARTLLGRPDRTSIAQIAAACGFYDQAHLDREFADFAGCSPTEWLSSDFPSVQDADDVDRAHSPV